MSRLNKIASRFRTQLPACPHSNLNLLAKENVKFPTPFSGRKIKPLLCSSKFYKMRKGLPWTAIVICMLVSCARPKEFEYLGFDNIKVLKWGLQETTVGLDVKFYNPNSALQLKKAEVDVEVNKNYLGRTVIDSTIYIPRKDTFIIPMTMKIGTVSAVSGILKSVTDSTVLVKLDGKATIGKSGIFFNYPIRYEGNQKTNKMLGIE